MMKLRFVVGFIIPTLFSGLAFYHYGKFLPTFTPTHKPLSAQAAKARRCAQPYQGCLYEKNLHISFGFGRHPHLRRRGHSAKACAAVCCGIDPPKRWAGCRALRPPLTKPSALPTPIFSPSPSCAGRCVTFAS